jgi:predicted transposase YdaD
MGKEQCYMKAKIKRDKIDYSYDIIDMRDIACEELLKSNDPSAVAISILCDFKDEDKQMVVNTILRKLREMNDDKEFENYLEMVTLYSTNRGLEKEVEKGVEMLTVDIEKTPFYQIGVQTGVAQGIERGIEKGKLEERFDNAIVMIEKFKLSIDDIVKELNIKKEELLEYMKQRKSK